jgi:hypothetical protein
MTPNKKAKRKTRHGKRTVTDAIHYRPGHVLGWWISAEANRLETSRHTAAQNLAALGHALRILNPDFYAEVARLVTTLHFSPSEAVLETLAFRNLHRKEQTPPAQ